MLLFSELQLWTVWGALDQTAASTNLSELAATGCGIF